MINELLSVIVPVYNVEQYIAQCIESIQKQTYRCLEIILVNDGSTDSSARICAYYASIDKRITLVDKKNEGVIKARIEGMSRARGQYITFVDSDDWLDEVAFEKMMGYAQKNEVVMAGKINVFNTLTQKEFIRIRPGYYDLEQIKTEIIPYMLWDYRIDAWGVDPSLCIKIFNKECLEKHLLNTKGLDVHFGDDSCVVYPMMLEVKNVFVIHEYHYYHRHCQKNEVAGYISDNKFLSKIYKVYSYLNDIFSKSDYSESLLRQLEHFYLKHIELRKQAWNEYRVASKVIFPYWRINKEARVVLYGAGDVGKQLYYQNKENCFCEIILWVDKNGVDTKRKHIVDHVYPINQMNNVEFDYVLIAVNSGDLACEIKSSLIRMQISEDKIIWSRGYIQEFL